MSNFLSEDGWFKSGNYEDKHISEVPDSYLSWIIYESNIVSTEIIDACEEELDRREEEGDHIDD